MYRDDAHIMCKRYTTDSNRMESMRKFSTKVFRHFSSHFECDWTLQVHYKRIINAQNFKFHSTNPLLKIFDDEMTREQTHQILFPIQVIRYQIENHTTIIEVRKYEQHFARTFAVGFIFQHYMHPFNTWSSMRLSSFS